MDSTTFERSPSAVAIPVLALISIILCLPPFVWHTKHRNLAASSLIFWIVVDNLFAFINALIWPTDDVASWWRGSVLCDVEVKLMMAGNAGLVGSMACIMRNLGQVMDTNRTIRDLSRASRRRQTCIDVLLCFGCPVYLMVIHYVVQPNRYYLFAIAGCAVSYDNSWPSTVLVFVWPPILCLVAAYYCGVVMIRLHRYRRDFADVLTSSGSDLTKSRFMRLFCIAFIFILVALPVQFYVFYRNVAVAHVPYSWSAVHGPSWWQIVMIPTGGAVQFDRWIWAGCGFLVFIFFGLGKDAVKMYRGWLVKLGFGNIFPSLVRDRTGSTSSLSRGSRMGSLSSMAKLVFRKRRSRGESTLGSYHGRLDSVTTEVFTPSPSDPKKGFFRQSGSSDAPASSPPSSLHEKSLTASSIDAVEHSPAHNVLPNEAYVSSRSGPTTAHQNASPAPTPRGVPLDISGAGRSIHGSDASVPSAYRELARIPELYGEH